MPLNTYACHTTHVCPTALIVYSTCRPHITAHTSKKTAIFNYCVYIMCANKKMPLKCHIFQLPPVHIWDNQVSIYTSYELTAINNLTRSTGIHTFHITGICFWTYKCATLYIYISLHFSCSLPVNPTLMHISIKNQYTAMFIYHTTAKSVPVTYVPLKCHMAKLLDVHQWGKYAKIQALTMWPGTLYIDIDDDTDALWWLPQSDYTYWVGHFAKSIKNKNRSTGPGWFGKILQYV